jgi:hypothetical protein
MSRRTVLLASAVAGLAAGAAATTLALLRRRRQTPLLELPPGPEVADDPNSDAPISRETRYDEELEAEERRRHEAAERLRADPFNERLEDENGA